MTTTLPTELEIAALAEELRSEDFTSYIYIALMALCRRYEKRIAELEAKLAELTPPQPTPIDYAKPVIVSQGAPRGEVDS